MYKLGIDVGGTNTDAVLIDENLKVVAAVKNPTSGDIYEGITNTELPQYFRESHVLNKEKCRDCWARFFCSGGCHANADLFHGDIRKPYEVGCEIQKKRLECAILVQALLALEKMEKEEQTTADGE